MATSAVDIHQLSINTIRTLSMDAVQAANSGHPGTPMALAPVAYTLWTQHLKFDPRHPDWIARDRFVLSCGHASMLLYSLLHLAGVEQDNGQPSITLDDIRNFRQLGSPCAGHPEYGHAAGIETTTGPLGQGIGNSVGMAAASKWLSAQYDVDNAGIADFDVYALASDGDLMEGIGSEAASLAGHLKLDNLCWIYDDNHITIDGRTNLTFSEDVPGRFAALGWQVLQVEDANDISAINQALTRFKSTANRPTLIIVRSIIGFGAPHKQDTASAHGAPLGEEEIRLAKESYDWDYDKFQIPDGVYEHFQETLGRRGAEAYNRWQDHRDQFARNYAEKSDELDLIQERRLPDGWPSVLPRFEAGVDAMATRVSSGIVLNALADAIPWLVGGSADLAGSNKSRIENDAAGDFSADNYGGRNLHFGIREHAMAAICNGLSLAGLRSYCATFFVFTDYLRPAMRLSSLMRQPVLYIFTHDSIGLGEDGPTHQPVEHLAACRAIPDLLVMRPGDANEVAQCYAVALAQSSRPTALILTRQNVPTLDVDHRVVADGVCKGAYVIRDCDEPGLIIIATGSELSIGMEAAAELESMGCQVRVVSMPCWRLFDEQPEEYRRFVLPDKISARIAVEAGIVQGWEKYIGSHGRFIGMSTFGASAPSGTLFEHFGITVEHIVQVAQEIS